MSFGGGEIIGGSTGGGGGGSGAPGTNGWTAVFDVVEDPPRARFVEILSDYKFGSGAKPTSGIGKYRGANALVDAIADAIRWNGVPGADSTVPGPSPTIAIGDVTTGAPGSQASAALRGTALARILDLTIPAGAAGSGGGGSGTPGQAATIAIGTVTTGAPGSQATVVNSGNSNAAVLDITIPRGNAGADSTVAGPKGDAATVELGNVTTGAAGSQAAVTQRGTSSARVLDFTIPRGAAGQDSTVAGPPGASPTLDIGNVTTGAVGSQAAAAMRGTALARILDLTIPAGPSTTGADGAGWMPSVSGPPSGVAPYNSMVFDRLSGLAWQYLKNGIENGSPIAVAPDAWVALSFLKPREFFGAGAPTNPIGSSNYGAQANDTYRNTSNGDVYRYSNAKIAGPITAPLAYVGPPVAVGAVGTPYASAVQFTGGVAPFTWSKGAGTWPTGLSIAAATGLISGTPSAAVTQSGLTVICTDATGQTFTTPAFQIAIAASGTAVPLNLTLMAYSLNAKESSAYTNIVKAGGGSGTGYVYALVANSPALPNGSTLNTASGILSGAPAVGSAGSYSGIRLQVTDSLGAVATVTLPTINVSQAAAGWGAAIQNLTGPAAAAGSQRTLLTADTTFYVRTNGSDANNGLANTTAGAFATLQAAYDSVQRTYDFAGYTATIQIADGTYTAGLSILLPCVGGLLVIQGNAGTPANVIVSTTGVPAVKVAKQGHNLTVRNMRLQTTTSGHCLHAVQGGIVSYSGIDFGACAGNHIAAENDAQVICTGNYTISGAAASHWAGYSTGQVNCRGFTITISNGPAFSVAFAYAQSLANLFVDLNTFSGAATGKRYQVESNAVINVSGAGANYVPGNAAGVTSGGLYV